jgi:hypothetical protein
MKKIVSLFILVWLTQIASSQAYIKARSISTVPNSCDNVAVCEYFGFDAPHYVTPADWSPVYFSNGDTIYNFCFYDIVTPGSMGLAGFAGNGYNSTLVIGTSLVTEDFNYTVTSYVEPTNESSQDGSLLVVFDSAVTSYDIFVMQDAYTPPYTIVDPYTLSFTNLNEGYLAINIQDLADIYHYVDFRIHVGDPDSIYSNTGMDVNVSFQHAGTSCNGWINLQANPPGTYYNTWSDDVANTTTRTNLCPGLYGVFSYNLVSGYYDQGSIDTVVITNDSLTYIDTNLYSMIPQDTSYYFTNDCFFDYYQPIDSILYNEDTIFYDGTLLIATFDMIIYQGSNIITYSDSLVTVADSTVLLDVVVYCTQFKSTFTGQRIMFLRGAENHFFVSPYLGEREKPVLNTAHIYPNPTQGDLQIDFIQSGDYTVQLIDYQGKILGTFEISEQQVTLPTDNLSNGTYILRVFSENEMQQYRFIKTGN